MMATCRYAQYLKAMMRDKIGSFMSPKTVERFLNRWIGQYVTQDDKASQKATKAKFPLARRACRSLKRFKGKPGVLSGYRFISGLTSSSMS